ncbi:hypothetical protein OUZ56_018581 [Daphnia magna]|uniref:Uncharacterized protein n=1 Tax=Daphnia magna TaxID=35525 RepID=A0ABQ9Z9E7_9CRUS|nr:hypothetical protein OUZ56_018581 [Daphnia magna]
MKKSVEVPGESLRMLKGSVPINFTGTGIVRALKNLGGAFRLSFVQEWEGQSPIVEFGIKADAEIAVVPTEQKEETDSNDGAARPMRMSCAAVRGYLRATIHEDVNTGPNLSGAEKEKVFELLDQHRRCLPSEETQLGRVMEIQHNIDTGG